MKGFNLLVILLVIGVVGYLVFKDKLALGMSKAEEKGVEQASKNTWEALVMSALQDLRIRF